MWADCGMGLNWMLDCFWSVHFAVVAIMANLAVVGGYERGRPSSFGLACWFGRCIYVSCFVMMFVIFLSSRSADLRPSSECG
jgi:hypothetical protein